MTLCFGAILNLFHNNAIVEPKANKFSLFFLTPIMALSMLTVCAARTYGRHIKQRNTLEWRNEIYILNSKRHAVLVFVDVLKLNSKNILPLKTVFLTICLLLLPVNIFVFVHCFVFVRTFFLHDSSCWLLMIKMRSWMQICREKNRKQTDLDGSIKNSKSYPKSQSFWLSFLYIRRKCFQWLQVIHSISLNYKVISSYISKMFASFVVTAQFCFVYDLYLELVALHP